jgi:hypothetical protein
MQSHFDDESFKSLSKGVLKYVTVSGPERGRYYAALLASPDRTRTDLAVVHIPQHELVARKLALAELDVRASNEHDNEIFAKWRHQKRLENDLLAAIAGMEAEAVSEVSPEFVSASLALYGAVDTDLFQSCLTYVLDAGYHPENPTLDSLSSEVKSMLGSITWQDDSLPVPTSEVFERYKDFAEAYFDEYLTRIDDFRHTYTGVISAKELTGLIAELLDVVGASREGWQVAVSDRVDRLSVNAVTRTIRVVDRELYMSFGRLRGLLLHEVGIHVVRRLHANDLRASVPVMSFEQLTKEEGLGVLVEQLVLQRFHVLRIFRYLAIGLAWGSDGQKRNAHEVYEILWRLRCVATGNQDQAKAKRFAALETMRVFRGIAPDVRGAVLLRDKAYLEGNVALWRMLIAEPVSYEDFKKLLQE